MPKSVLVVLSRPTKPSTEDEYNEWYDNRHLREVTEIPGFGEARRYKLSGTQLDEPGAELGDGYEYLAIYEIETDDLETIKSELRERGEDGRMYVPAEIIEQDPRSPAWLFDQI